MLVVSLSLWRTRSESIGMRSNVGGSIDGLHILDSWAGADHCLPAQGFPLWLESHRKSPVFAIFTGPGKKNHILPHSDLGGRVVRDPSTSRRSAQICHQEPPTFFIRPFPRRLFTTQKRSGSLWCAILRCQEDEI